jgi:hypothetical protein
MAPWLFGAVSTRGSWTEGDKVKLGLNEEAISDLNICSLRSSIIWEVVMIFAALLVGVGE